MTTHGRPTTVWTFVVTSLALVMVTLDNLVVTTALPVIKAKLHASLVSLEWTVNAYTLTFAVLLLTGAALGDRFGRRRVFVIGLLVFTAASAAAALAPNVGVLIAARAVQGLGGALVTPLTLTLLSAAVPPDKRGLALGAWGGVGGLAVALGPLVGGAIVDGFSWQWIFWLNVPIGLALMPVALRRLQESRGPNERLDFPGLVLISAGLFGIVWGLVRGNGSGLGERRDRHGARPGNCPCRAVRHLGTPGCGADAADAVLPESDVHSRPTSRLCSCSSACSVVLPPGAVLSDRPGQHATWFWIAHLPWTANAGRRCTDRGGSLIASMDRASAEGLATQAGGLAWIERYPSQPSPTRNSCSRSSSRAQAWASSWHPWRT